MSKKLSDAYKKGAATAAPSSPLKGEFVLAKVADLIPNNIRPLNEAKVEDFRRSFRQVGQIENITINGENKILGGHHRFEAAKREGWEEIRAVRRTDLGPEDEVLLQVHENTMRSELTLTQKMAHCSWLKEQFVGSAGNPSLISRNCEKLENHAKNKGAHLDDLVVEHGIFKSKDEYYRAKLVFENCIPEVFDLIDKGAIVYSFAATKIATISKDKQKTALHHLVEDPKSGADRKGIKKAVKERLQQQRLAKSGTPSAFVPLSRPEDRYLVARAVPNWDKEKLEDLKLIPVGDYMADNGVMCIVAPNKYVGKAYKLMWSWGFHDDTMFSVGYPNPTTATGILEMADASVGLLRLIGDSMHVVVGYYKVNKSPVAEHVRKFPLWRHLDIHAYAVQIIDELFRDEKTETRLLDVCATVSKDGWASLKDRYGRKDK